MQVDKMALKKLGTEQGNNEDDSNRSNSSNQTRRSSSNKMASKKLGMEQGNNEDDSNRSNSSKRTRRSSSKKKMKEAMVINPFPPEILEVISQKLLSFDDIFSFSDVCTEWRAVQKTYWRKFLESHSPLIVHTTTYAKKFCSFYSIPENRAYSSKLSNIWGLSYSGSSSGYLTMAGANKTLHLINPFKRNKKIIDTSMIVKDWTYFAGRVLIAFAKGSDEFLVLASCKRLFGLYVYQSQNCSWQTYSKMGHPWKIVDFAVFKNIIYVLTDKAEVGVLSLNSGSLKFLNLKNTPDVPSSRLYHLLSCDGELLVVRFEPNQVLDIYKIDRETMSYVKLDTLGDIALFHSSYKCYALANPGKWGYESNRVYHINWEWGQYEVYSGSNNELIESFLLAGNHQIPSKSRPYWMDWCFRNQPDEVDYSLVE
ncbi:uncharacterized protein LOC123889411 isoform X1 [Trifolium pratense]|uniref:uncharacterized protein LOC123889411 isoform X1 n=1 Tax=Trifolium pratense TaxID=57577 RepID=UPI001E69744E|nr:uncharacterized protein LOC123889411 isoform X1 [Trifolium pratense]XP_045794697.1 uncharacterized protein LOC123889411 isoform X1 [Trifolium pratense]XP_045794698.1 uncharacterized protein LOC123889411 isoform X1 [Trifolium pratense]XP_045794699.1 uncharacterized protein LOC123889411 isoform X1 [Trifolium pratense]XP_045794700.1 uncharacterized protein LOC123889411 isoform X1 [Trifolium pratense]XP_045794701.1 uncharacterized protein LOC123889411 isoform X1 [Trifolium pratense]XP_04579470